MRLWVAQSRIADTSGVRQLMVPIRRPGGE